MMRRKKTPLKEFSEELSMPEEKLLEIMMAAAQITSLDTPVSDDGDLRVQDLIAGPGNDPLEAAMGVSLHDDLEEALQTLTERERKVLILRYGLLDDRPRTLEDVGRIEGVTRERIRQDVAR